VRFTECFTWNPWALLGDVVGCLVWLLLRVTGHYVYTYGSLHDVYGPAPYWFERRGGEAFTASSCFTFMWAPDSSYAPMDSLYRHEARHRRQAYLLGPLYLPVYGAIWIALACWYRSARKAYDRHPMERDANG